MTSIARYILPHWFLFVLSRAAVLTSKRCLGLLVQGTALYALQSCMNHSSDPNAETTKEDSDMDGKAVISAKLDIGEGEEVLISYVDLDAPESEQRSALRDYGIQS